MDGDAPPQRPQSHAREALSIEVLQTGSWRVHSGGAWSGESGGIVGQLTKCRLDGVVFYLRENLGGVDPFFISSSARLGMKKGQNPAHSTQVLDLAAPAERWGEIAAAVRAADGMGRPVRRHARFTADWAEQRLGGAR